VAFIQISLMTKDIEHFVPLGYCFGEVSLQILLGFHCKVAIFLYMC
jgi:hypothetical protein